MDKLIVQACLWLVAGGVLLALLVRRRRRRAFHW
jgi:hypothetical protein